MQNTQAEMLIWGAGGACALAAGDRFILAMGCAFVLQTRCTPQEMPYPATFAHEYARTKALGEQAVLAEHGPQIRCCAVAPHQVYGPTDQVGPLEYLRAVGGGGGGP